MPKTMFFILFFVFTVQYAFPAIQQPDHVIKTYEDCIRCHPRANPTHAMQHQVRRRTMDLPFGPGGKMICITCHDCKDGKCFVRTANPAALCKSCHDCTQGMACLIGTAHLGNSKTLSVKIDECRNCHDRTGEMSIGMKGGHPVDVPYLLYKRSYKMINDRRVVLIDGKVTCLSCHNPYSSEKHRLVVPNEKASLCLTCHNK